MPEQRVFVLHGGLEPAQKICVHVLRGEGVEVVQLGRSELGEVELSDPFELMRQVDDWAEQKRGENGRAFPTFVSSGEGYSQRFEVVHLAASLVQRNDTMAKDLWPEPFKPNQVGHFFRVAHDHCRRTGFATGFPNGFWSSEEGPDRSYQIVAIREGCASEAYADIPALGALPQEDLVCYFQHAQRWAVEHGFAAGIPNFHARDWHRSWGERSELTRAEQDLNHLLGHEGWRVARVDPIKLSDERAGLSYLLEKG